MLLEMIEAVVKNKQVETTGHEILKKVHPHPTMSESGYGKLFR